MEAPPIVAAQPSGRASGAKEVPFLRVQGLTKIFSGVTALDGLDLLMNSDEAVAVIGPNGAGKTTLLKLIAGVHRPTRGTITLDGDRLDRLSAHGIANSGVGLAHQVPRPFPSLTVRDNVKVAISADGSGRTADARVSDVLDFCGLAGKHDMAAGSLRILDLKRLEVARALAHSPRLLMLDEVAAGLTGKDLDDAIDLIRRIRSSGVAVLLVEHIERVVREIADRIVVLDWGKQMAVGTPAEIAANADVRRVYVGEVHAGPSSRSRPVVQSRPAVLEVDSLSAGYATMLAIRDVTIGVGEGEIVALLGANGAGKSTLAHAISGGVSVRRGAVRLFGTDVTREATHARARRGLGHCPEGRHVFAGLTVQENLELGAPLRLDRKELRARLANVSDVFPVLFERRSQAAETLSGGQQQMVAIGRALMAEPRLLICDEISLGLAPIAIDSLYVALERINSAGVAILLIEQNIQRCLQLADRACVLSRGRITYDGPPGPLTDAELLDRCYFGNDTDQSP